MKRTSAFFFLCILVLIAFAGNTQAEVTVLHEFIGGVDDGAYPHGSVISDGTWLYGMSHGGGNIDGSDYGVIFRVKSDGSDFELLHVFAGGVDDGMYPSGSLVLADSVLYGMAHRGGDFDKGVIFKINVDGTEYALLHEFSGGEEDGATPLDSLVCDINNSTLYGTTVYGGANNRGVIFKMSTNGANFVLLHEFSGGDGRNPDSSLLLDNNTLYGTTAAGGYNRGVIFKIATDGSYFEVLHLFAGGADDGAYPHTLISDGLSLYGTTTNGGDAYKGVIFKIGTDGLGYEVLHEFALYPDAYTPHGSLVFDGLELYGMTYWGGDYNHGAIFKINTDGSGYEVIHSFARVDGRSPDDSLLLDGFTLYGMTVYGGEEERGVIFSLPLP